jgi:hypothetical protein
MGPFQNETFADFAVLFYREVCGGGSRLLWNIFSKVLYNGKKK